MIKISTIPENFEPISTQSNYTKLVAGKHRLRILGPAITGFLWWTEEKDGTRKPNRIPLDQNPPVSEAESIRRFLTFPVWNYEFDRIQVLEITQSSIQKELKAYEKDPEWGSLETYDIEITREGTDKQNTRYRVSVKPKSGLGEDIKKAIKEGLPVLAALYKNEDPFTFNPNATDDVNADEIKD